MDFIDIWGVEVVLIPYGTGVTYKERNRIRTIVLLMQGTTSVQDYLRKKQNNSSESRVGVNKR
ncbi:hypothetical protein ASG85_22175 [Paenibacillus sp. Soil724D2]|nr:hypothetical protein ASG85_22175 [Paenibacillus sp. Soil724D2]